MAITWAHQPMKQPVLIMFFIWKLMHRHFQSIKSWSPNEAKFPAPLVSSIQPHQFLHFGSSPAIFFREEKTWSPSFHGKAIRPLVSTMKPPHQNWPILFSTKQQSHHLIHKNPEKHQLILPNPKKPKSKHCFDSLRYTTLKVATLEQNHGEWSQNKNKELRLMK